MIVDKLIKKVETEYEIFYMDMIKTSRENIFAKSSEIEKKKDIVRYLKKAIRVNKNLCFNMMLTANNLLDEFYRYVIDHDDKDQELVLNEYMKNYQELS